MLNPYPQYIILWLYPQCLFSATTNIIVVWKIGVVITIFDYEPLWNTMERMQVSQYQLLKGGIDNKTLDSLKKGKNITMVTLEKLCKIIGCTPNDIVEFK